MVLKAEFRIGHSNLKKNFSVSLKRKNTEVMKVQVAFSFSLQGNICSFAFRVEKGKRNESIKSLFHASLRVKFLSKD